MSAPIPFTSPSFPLSRTGWLAAASVVVATTSVAVTLAVSTGGDDEPAPSPGGEPARAAEQSPR
jgi:hypothetical protein